MYATKKRKRNMKQLKTPPVAAANDPPKSNPSKRHRERLNSELDHLASLLPYEQGIISKLDKLSVLRLAVNYLRTKSYFQAALYDKLLNGGYHKPSSSLQNSVLRSGAFSGHEAAALYSNGGGGGGGKSEVSTSSDVNVIAGADDILQALNGFLLVVTCEGEVFFASDTVEQYLGFHQSDIIHQSVLELIHSEDREQFKMQLLCRPSFDMSDHVVSDHVTESYLHIGNHQRRFNVRFRCLLDNTSGFITLEITGRLRVLHGQSLKSNASKTFALFALCSPLGVLPSNESQGQDTTFKSKHKMDMSPLSMDPRGKAIFGFTDRELIDKRGYDLIHYDDLTYYAAAHQELIKTGSSGLIAYRLANKDFRWVWLQTSSKVVYKNSKPDYISCIHRQLTEDEGNDLIGKRGSEFKLPYALIYEPPGFSADTFTTAAIDSATSTSLSSTSRSSPAYRNDDSRTSASSSSAGAASDSAPDGASGHDNTVGIEPEGARLDAPISTTDGLARSATEPNKYVKNPATMTNTTRCNGYSIKPSAQKKPGNKTSRTDNGESYSSGGRKHESSCSKVVSEAESMNAAATKSVRGRQKASKKSRGPLKDYLQAGRKRKVPYRDMMAASNSQQHHYHQQRQHAGDGQNSAGSSEPAASGETTCDRNNNNNHGRDAAGVKFYPDADGISSRNGLYEDGLYGYPYFPPYQFSRPYFEAGYAGCQSFSRYLSQNDDCYYNNELNDSRQYYNYCYRYYNSPNSTGVRAADKGISSQSYVSENGDYLYERSNSSATPWPSSFYCSKQFQLPAAAEAVRSQNCEVTAKYYDTATTGLMASQSNQLTALGSSQENHYPYFLPRQLGSETRQAEQLAPSTFNYIGHYSQLDQPIYANEADYKTHKNRTPDLHQGKPISATNSAHVSSFPSSSAFHEMINCPQYHLPLELTRIPSPSSPSSQSATSKQQQQQSPTMATDFNYIDKENVGRNHAEVNNNSRKTFYGPISTPPLCYESTSSASLLSGGHFLTLGPLPAKKHNSHGVYTPHSTDEENRISQDDRVSSNYHGHTLNQMSNSAGQRDGYDSASGDCQHYRTDSNGYGANRNKTSYLSPADVTMHRQINDRHDYHYSPLYRPSYHELQQQQQTFSSPSCFSVSGTAEVVAGRCLAGLQVSRAEALGDDDTERTGDGSFRYAAPSDCLAPMENNEMEKILNRSKDGETISKMAPAEQRATSSTAGNAASSSSQSAPSCTTDSHATDGSLASQSCGYRSVIRLHSRSTHQLGVSVIQKPASVSGHAIL